jgi:hypothetical protein
LFHASYSIKHPIGGDAYSILQDNLNGSFIEIGTLSASGRLPTDVILRPPAALRHVAGGPTKK